MSRHMTTDEVAAETGIPVETLRYWRYVGRGPESFKLGKRVMYDRADVEAFIADAKAASRNRSATA